MPCVSLHHMKRPETMPVSGLFFYSCGFSGFAFSRNATEFYGSCALFALKTHTEMHTKTGLLVRVMNGLQPFLDGIVI